ncbi:MAG TPA: pyridoxal phosphate-dependent aminotransferase [Polyangiaceae bacterium]|nr:pyridoxal phosphate-dependent aminotransferase [Polyangiaceae bacterium]
MTFSTRSAFESAPNELAVALERRRARGEAVIDLTESNPTRAGIPYDERAITEALADPRSMRYEPEPFGLPSARDVIARMYGVDASRVMLTASTSEAYGFLFTLLCDPGDEVLTPAPSYPLFAQLARIAGVRLVPYRLRYDGAWHVDLASLRAARTDRSRAILAVSPNNPTGSCLRREELAAMLDLPVICDEVFAEYTFRGDAERVPCAAKEARGGLVFSMGGLSKSAALPQMKLAWTIVGGPEARVAPALERLAFVADAYLSVATPVQHALPKLLAVGRKSRDAIVTRATKNLAVLDSATRGTTATRLDLEAGWYATLRVPHIRSEMETCLAALERGVYVHPGAFFGFEDEAYVIISLLAPEDDFARGTKLLLETITE